MAALLGAAAGLGAVSVLAKLAYSAGAQPPSLLTARIAVAAVLLVPLAARRRTLGEVPLQARHLALGALGGAAFATAGLLEFEALSRAPAATVVLLVFVAPVWVALASWALWRTPPGWARCGMIALVLAGTALLVATPDRQGLDHGAVALALIASVLSAAFFLTMAELVAQVRPRRATCLLATGAAPCSIVATAEAPMAAFGSVPVGWYALSIGALTACSLWLLCTGLGRTSALSGSAIAGAEPVVAALLSWLVLGEVLGTLQLIGAIAVLAGAPRCQRMPYASRDSRARRHWSKPTAATRITPTTTSCQNRSTPPISRPLASTTGMKTPTTVAPISPTPPVRLAPPMTTAASAAINSVVWPVETLATANRATSSRPAHPASAPDSTYSSNRCLPIAIPPLRAASSFEPIR